MLSPETAILMQRGIVSECRNRKTTMASRFAVIDDDRGLALQPQDPEIYKDFSFYLDSAVASAVPVVWNMDIWNAAVRDADKVFPDLKLDLLESTRAIAEHQLWLFQGVHFLDYDPTEWGFDNRQMSLDAALIGISDFGLAITLFFMPTHDWRADGVVTHYVRQINPIRDGVRINARAATFVAAAHFLGLKLVALEDYLPRNKSQRRRLNKDESIPDIRVVSLRRRNVAEAQSHRSVDWQHQWLVSGHWRKQWYPSLSEHRPIYIQPHMKGPEDKPLMPVRQTLYRATR